MVILNFFKKKSDPNTHQNAPLKKVFSGGMPPNPRNKAHGAACRLAICKFRNLKKILAPLPPPNPGYAPDYI